MPRIPKADPPVTFKCSLPESLALRVDVRLGIDPLRGQRRYGERSKLVERLLREWVERSGK